MYMLQSDVYKAGNDQGVQSSVSRQNSSHSQNTHPETEKGNLTAPTKKKRFNSLLKHYLHSSRTTAQVSADRSEEDSSSSSKNTECLNKKRKSSWSKSEHEVYKSMMYTG